MVQLEKIKELSKSFMYEEFNKNSISYLELKKSFIEDLKKDNQKSFSEEDFEIIFFISHTIGNKPFITQEEIYNLIKKKLNNNISFDKLVELNNQIRQSDLCQNLIINYSVGSKYWKNTIIPINESGSINNTLEKKPVHPYRIGIYPGLSCMFECVFCGRNYSAKYDRSLLDEGIEKYKDLINSSPKEDKFKFYISGGLEPLTNPKLNTLIKELKTNGFEVPLYTNGQMLTEKYLKKADFIKDLYSIRISLYGTDEDQYQKTVQKKNQFNLVKNNIVNLIKFKNENNLKTSIGLNYILLDGRSDDMLKLLDFIKDINESVGNDKNNINFLTLREDFRSTTNLRLKRSERLELVETFKKFQEKINNEIVYEGMFVDYGYSLEPIKNGLVDHVYEDVFADEKILLKEGAPNISIAIDLYGDVYAYREAAFLDRPGSKRYILGRIDNNVNLNQIIDMAIKKDRNILQNKNDLDYLDAFDHIVLRTLDQAKKDKSFGIPFELGPVNSRIYFSEKKTVNFQTHFSYPLE
tara:strand:+ start:61 stop:1632 length:1572 start_codon:yes stop_codon:yes gene_type:complete